MKKHSEYVAAYRARQKAKRRCRQCSEPAAVRPDGTPYAACNRHLNADAERKELRRKAKPSE